MADGWAGTPPPQQQQQWAPQGWSGHSTLNAGAAPFVPGARRHVDAAAGDGSPPPAEQPLAEQVPPLAGPDSDPTPPPPPDPLCDSEEADSARGWPSYIDDGIIVLDVRACTWDHFRESVRPDLDDPARQLHTFRGEPLHGIRLVGFVADEAVADVCDAIRQHQDLQEICFLHLGPGYAGEEAPSPFSLAGWRQLCGMVRDCPITALELTNVMLDDGPAFPLALALEHNETLKVLSLNARWCRPKALQSVLRPLRTARGLESVHFGLLAEPWVVRELCGVVETNRSLLSVALPHMPRPLMTDTWDGFQLHERLEVNGMLKELLPYRPAHHTRWPRSWMLLIRFLWAVWLRLGGRGWAPAATDAAAQTWVGVLQFLDPYEHVRTHCRLWMKGGKVKM
eukprot:TRINITY_DN48000_c0_g1_i1.p1 TRINITY_DN48000_c0_g1~~TRINITY_DN48000_c0_g1_i1.p1  ORF type:complete len:404 (+),score=103.29 TRINITY_DN48000_c0_g1_i1:27-1214(+)